MRGASTPAASCFLFDGGRLRKHERPRYRRHSLQPHRQLCPRQTARRRDHPNGVRPSPRAAMLHLANIKCLRFDRHTRRNRQGIISRICRAIHDEAPIFFGAMAEIRRTIFSSTTSSTRCRSIVDRGLTGTFNVASEQSLSVHEIVSLVESFAGKKLQLAHCACLSWDVEESRISAQKTRAKRPDGTRDMISPTAIQQLTEAELKCV